jgi:hypothetical protein
MVSLRRKTSDSSAVGVTDRQGLKAILDARKALYLKIIAAKVSLTCRK